MRSSWMPNCILSVEEKMCKGANIYAYNEKRKKKECQSVL